MLHGIRNLLKRKVLGSNYAANCKLTASLVTTLICITIFSWILTILMLSGDIHPNPGPASLSSLTSGSESSAASFLPMNFTNLSNHLSFVHYNVQSLAPKLDILGRELFEFDTRGYQKVLSLTWKELEIWIYSALFFNVVPFQLHTLVPSSFPVINTRSVEVNILVP